MRSSSARRAATQGSSEAAGALTAGRSLVILRRSSLFDFERRGAAGREQRLDLLLGAVEDHRSAAAQLHPLLERAQALLERKVSALETLDQPAQAAEDVLETLGCRIAFVLTRHASSFYADLG